MYDPGRAHERAWARGWLGLLRAADPALRVRRNVPYRGAADGLTSHLRRRFAPARYAGLELEVNQRFPLGPEQRWRALRTLLWRSLAASLPSREV